MITWKRKLESAITLSFYNAVGGCLCPISSSIILMYTASRAKMYNAASASSVDNLLTCLIMWAVLRIAPLFCGILASLNKKMTACSTSCFWFAQVTCIAVDCKFHVADAVCDYVVFLCCDVIQQLMCLFNSFFVRLCGLVCDGVDWAYQSDDCSSQKQNVLHTY